MSLAPHDAVIAYNLLLLEAIELSEKAYERLEELYKKYPSQELQHTIERFSRISDQLASFEKQQEQKCADTCSGETLY